MRQSTYADAEVPLFMAFVSIFYVKNPAFYLFVDCYGLFVGQEDPSQVLALATVWILLLALGSSAYLIPTILTISIALEDGFSSKSFISSRNYPFDLVPMLTNALFTVFGFAIGYPIASSSGKLY